MSNFDDRNAEELAYLLWEKQGRPQNRSVQNWLEAESLAPPPATSLRPTDPENEVDLRMRGLGPLTQEVVSEPIDSPRNGNKKGLILFSCLFGAGLVVGAGMIFSSGKFRDGFFRS